jgi:hypothetical protein
MRKQNWIVNVVLLALAVALAMKLRGDWVRTAQQRKAADAFEQHGLTSAPTAPNMAPAQIPGADLITQNNLFSPDRNNVQPQAVELRPAPPDPLLVGEMNVGSGPIALMVDGAAQPGTSPHPVRVGESIGGYKLTKVADTYAMVEYEGQEKRVELQSEPRYDNSRAPAASSVPQRAQPQTTSAPPPKAVGPNKSITVLPENGKNSTGDPKTRTSFDMFGPNVQDTYPAGTVLNGWQKVEHPWPFGGKQVWWEKVQ